MFYEDEQNIFKSSHKFVDNWLILFVLYKVEKKELVERFIRKFEDWYEERKWRGESWRLKNNTDYNIKKKVKNEEGNKK